MKIHEITLINGFNWTIESLRVDALIRAYTTQFWSASWKELLAVRNPEGRVLRQFGTCDQKGEVFPETLSLLRRTGLSVRSPDWPQRIWDLADRGLLTSDEGATLSPYWTYASAERELHTFVAPRENGGYGGEMLLATSDDRIVGFTAYACAQGQAGRAVAGKRFPTGRLHIPVDDVHPSDCTIDGMLAKLYPGDLAFGIFLDHAVSEVSRGKRVGSCLFDARLDRLLELGADVIFGRTLVTEPRQYVGNYLARGLMPIAADGTDAFSRNKHYFAATRNMIRPRKPR